MGTRSLDTYDDFVQEWYGAGSRKATDYFNSIFPDVGPALRLQEICSSKNDDPPFVAQGGAVAGSPFTIGLHCADLSEHPAFCMFRKQRQCAIAARRKKGR